LVATFAPNSFLIILYAIIYTLSFCASAWPVFHTHRYYVPAILDTLCPLTWAFYFKSKFKKTLAKNAENESKI